MKSLEVIIKGHIALCISGGIDDYYRELLESILTEYYNQLELKIETVDKEPINYPFM